VNTVKEIVETGDVVEFELEGELATALVLLASDDTLILDLCDGEMPLVARFHEITGLRRFAPDDSDLIAA
jgi:hypothetical protein